MMKCMHGVVRVATSTFDLGKLEEWNEGRFVDSVDSHTASPPQMSFLFAQVVSLHSCTTLINNVLLKTRNRILLEISSCLESVLAVVWCCVA